MPKLYSMQIPAEEIELLDDGVYRVSVGKYYQFVSSSHLIQPHVNQLRERYKQDYDEAVQPYLE
jgi:hypothetical protein